MRPRIRTAIIAQWLGIREHDGELFGKYVIPGDTMTNVALNVLVRGDIIGDRRGRPVDLKVKIADQYDCWHKGVVENIRIN